MARQRRDAGVPPYSLKLGGKWYGYNKIEPLGTTLGTVADTVELMRYAHEEDNQDLATSLIFGIGNAMLSKTYMSGASNFLDALHNPDRSGNYANGVLASMAMPGSADMVMRGLDPWLRSHQGLFSAIAARTPGVSMTLPPLRNRWGDPIPRQEGLLPQFMGPAGAPVTDALGRMVSPVSVSDAKAGEPIDKWIWANRDAFPQSDQGRLGLDGFSRPQISVGNGQATAHLQLTPTQLDRLRELAGNGMKDENGLGAKDALNALVAGKHPDSDMQDSWNQATPEARALTVLKIYNASKSGAKQQLLRENTDLREAAQAQMKGRAAQLVGPSGSSPILDGATP